MDQLKSQRQATATETATVLSLFPKTVFHFEKLHWHWVLFWSHRICYFLGDLKNYEKIWGPQIKVTTWGGSWRGIVWSKAPMLTDSKFAQCPHLTVTIVNTLLHGTLTCKTNLIMKYNPNYLFFHFCLGPPPSCFIFLIGNFFYIKTRQRVHWRGLL